jgi:hypothetical protein
MSHERSLAFREVQRFRQVWLWILLIAVAATELGTFGYGIIQQIFFREPFGDDPMSDVMLLAIGVPVLLITVGLLPFFCILRLETEVRSDGLFVRFFPLHLSYKRIPLEDVEKIEARTYSPILHYGGWGIRWGIHGKAYNVSGNRGVRLDFSNGRHLLIGSERCEELAEAIDPVWKRKARSRNNHGRA